MIDSEKPLIATQSNRLVESRYTLTVGEQRLILAMISLIHPDDEDFKPYIIKITDLAYILNIHLKNVYREVDKITDRLMERVLHIPLGGHDWLKTHWVSSAIHKEGKVTLSFDPTLKPYLLKLKEQFTRYRLTIITQFKSIYTIRIYGLLKQYEPLHAREFELSEFRRILGIKEEYQEFKRFKTRVLNQAKKEFEKKNEVGAYQSDITFDLEAIRQGRKIVRLRFIIKKQVYQEELPLEMHEDSLLIARLKKYEVAEHEATRYIKEQGEEAVWRAVEILEEKMTKKSITQNPGGYLIKLLREKAGVLRLETEQQQKQQREEKQKAHEAREHLEAAAEDVISQHLLALTERGKENYFAVDAKQREQLENSFCRGLPSLLRKEWTAAGGYTDKLSKRLQLTFFGHVARITIPKDERSLTRYCQQEDINEKITAELQRQGKI